MSDRNRYDHSARRTPPSRRHVQGARAPRQGAQQQRQQRPAPARKPQRTRHPVLRGLFIFGILVLLAGGITAGVVYATMAKQLPDPSTQSARGRDQSSIVYDAKGRVIAKIYAEQDRTDKQLNQIPATLRNAVIATEDRRFYQHKGVDPLGILRAVLTDITRGEKAQGGSTITQQYVKQAFVTPEKTLKRKVMEAMLANKLERKYTKDEILQLYLNTIYFGHGAYGVESAAQAYFGKPVEKLDLAQSATLAGIIKAPSHYSPYIDPVAAKRRRDTVLGLMRQQGFIDEAAFAGAVASPVKTAGLKSKAKVAPYFLEYVREQLIKKFGSDAVYRGGLRVTTTLDLPMQRAAERAVADELNRKGDPSAALVAIEPGTGAIKAMVGGRDFNTQQFNVATQGKRQPGSSFKPFVLAAALADGVSPEQTFESGPRKFPVGDQTWSVTGASGGRTGPMRLREATEKSVNSVFAQLIMDVGPEKVVELGEKLGLHKGIEPVPAIALGGLETGVSPLEMANAYATLAAQGKRATPYSITKVTDAKGAVLLATKPKRTEALDADVAYLTTNMLTGVISKGTGKAAAIDRPVAGKTGTTQEYRDAWFVGYTPQLATAVWVGYPDAQREMTSVHGIKVTGGSFPAQIFSAFMRSALKGRPKVDFTRTSGIVSSKICLDSGVKPTPFCPRVGSGIFLRSTELSTCPLHTTPTSVKMPNLVGLTKDAALALLNNLKLAFKVTEADVAGVAAGIVAKQTPTQGSIATTSTVVSLLVSNGGIANKQPVPQFTMPASAKAKHAISFDASQSTDDGKIVKWMWEFGDGGTASGVKTTHAYAAPGTYEVTLWVTDDHGEQASLTRQISIK